MANKNTNSADNQKTNKNTEIRDVIHGNDNTQNYYTTAGCSLFKGCLDTTSKLKSD